MKILKEMFIRRNSLTSLYINRPITTVDSNLKLKSSQYGKDPSNEIILEMNPAGNKENFTGAVRQGKR